MYLWTIINDLVQVKHFCEIGKEEHTVGIDYVTFAQLKDHRSRVWT